MSLFCPRISLRGLLRSDRTSNLVSSIQEGDNLGQRRNHPGVTFERYADDILVHCKTETEAKNLKTGIGERLGQCNLELHSEKTKIVYCKDDNRRSSYTNEKFDFLGFTFRPRLTKSRWGKFFVNFSPAISNEAAKSIQEAIRNWK